MEPEELIKEAKRRGYTANRTIRYLGRSETTKMGNGEIEFSHGRLLRFETKKQKDGTDDFRRFDVIWDSNHGWVELISRKDRNK